MGDCYSWLWSHEDCICIINFKQWAVQIFDPRVKERKISSATKKNSLVLYSFMFLETKWNKNKIQTIPGMRPVSLGSLAKPRVIKCLINQLCSPSCVGQLVNRHEGRQGQAEPRTRNSCSMMTLQRTVDLKLCKGRKEFVLFFVGDISHISTKLISPWTLNRDSYVFFPLFVM